MKRERVARSEDVGPNACLSVEASGIGIALCRVQGRLYALDNCCPHAGGPLGEGYVEGRTLVCPWHAWRYDVATGERPENPDIRVQTYPVEEVDGDIIVHLPGSESASRTSPED